MWENAAKHTDTPPAPPAAAEPGEYDTLLWAQIILCVLIAAGVFAARALELPLYSTLRIILLSRLYTSKIGRAHV